MSTFLPNARVALHGLNAGHVYNGRFGIVLEGPDPTTTRYKVCMDVEIGLNKYLNVKATNLQPSNAQPLPMGQAGAADMAFASLSPIYEDDREDPMGQEKFILKQILWSWFYKGGDPDKAADFLESYQVSRAALNAAAQQRLLYTPHFFFRANSPLLLPPRPPKKLFANHADMQRAAFQLLQPQPYLLNGYPYTLTTAGPFTINHYSNTPVLSYHGSPITDLLVPVVDFHPFLISLTEPSKTTPSKTKLYHPVNALLVPEHGGALGTRIPSQTTTANKSRRRNHQKPKSAKWFFFDAFCAVCNMEGASCGDNMGDEQRTYVRGVHGMVLISFLSMVKSIAFEKPDKRLVPFERALRNALTLLSVRLAANGEEWRDAVLPRHDTEAKRAQAIEVVNYARVYHELGEVVEAQGDYADAARQYELACQTIKNGLEQGVLAEFQQGKDALEATLPASRAGMLNSWGLALKRCGKFQKAMQIYQQALSLDPQNAVFKNNLKNCRNAVSNFKVNGATSEQLAERSGQLNVSGLNLKQTYKNYSKNKYMANCSLPSCLQLGEKTSFKTCGRCHLAMYCSKEHQREDWPRHKKECKAKVVKQ